MDAAADPRREWLETDGLGGFASGTAGLVRTRRYHALLLTATTPPTGRKVLVNGFDAHVETGHGDQALSTQHYVPDVLHPDGATRVRSFSADPWPTWEFELLDGSRLRQEILVEHGSGTTLIAWTRVSGDGIARLRVRPFLSGRDYHSTHHENTAFAFSAHVRGQAVGFRPYDGVPPILFLTNGTYLHGPAWYRQFFYREEQARGLDATEDLAAPGELVYELDAAAPRAVWIMRADTDTRSERWQRSDVLTLADDIRAREQARRQAFSSPLDRAADAYLVKRGTGRTIVAGYPWFTDWGRDTFIALRGLCLATGHLEIARDILLEWAGTVSEGMLPNRFPDGGDRPEYNSVDASLWYVVAVTELLERANGRPRLLTTAERTRLEQACLAIVDGYSRGTRFGIRADADGLLAAGSPGVQLTWMDAVVNGRVVTPRIGKPVEVQALWINALRAVASLDPQRGHQAAEATASFEQRFWLEDRGFLADVVDVDHVPGTVDATFRPNQILAVGGLPVPLVTGARARQIVDAVAQRLLTPLGLRSLAPDEPGYAARYEGDWAARDGVYHQGTAWAWLLGPFVEAWIRVRQSTPSAKRAARRELLVPLLAHLDEAGLGHVSEIADAEAPFTPRGCPFQAWSLGELLRIDRQVLAGRRAPDARRRQIA